MENYDILILNIYLLAIFTVLVKTKTNGVIYRVFKLLNVTLFVYLLMIIFREDVEVFDIVVKIVPLLFLMIIVVQTEVFIILKKLGFRRGDVFRNTLEDNIKIELVKSIDHLSMKRIGAIITMEKTTPLEEFIDNAYSVEAPLSSELLATIFYPQTPLHDGAVIIRRNQIVCAGAYFPSTEKLDIPKQMGSRHRAAIGISEVSDSLTIVVSEQTGSISVAYNGYLDFDINKESLLIYLSKHLQT